ncbi:hypothetical protein Cgig2_010598 [Carnegiea gigantea]|uniref:Pentatricopeptide repeat-containing protein n=1 Tax=Carnegiea gigantea TaxID=171969 RepID=A0A9Q1QP80_9CARY|nr:hypothetical protein Cgig2_010598 [Carnegiea gigantea]
MMQILQLPTYPSRKTFKTPLSVSVRRYRGLVELKEEPLSALKYYRSAKQQGGFNGGHDSFCVLLHILVGFQDQKMLVYQWVSSHKCPDAAIVFNSLIETAKRFGFDLDRLLFNCLLRGYVHADRFEDAIVCLNGMIDNSTDLRISSVNGVLNVLREGLYIKNLSQDWFIIIPKQSVTVICNEAHKPGHTPIKRRRCLSLQFNLDQKFPEYFTSALNNSPDKIPSQILDISTRWSTKEPRRWGYTGLIIIRRHRKWDTMFSQQTTKFILQLIQSSLKQSTIKARLPATVLKVSQTPQGILKFCKIPLIGKSVILQVPREIISGVRQQRLLETMHSIKDLKYSSSRPHSPVYVAHNRHKGILVCPNRSNSSLKVR